MVALKTALKLIKKLNLFTYSLEILKQHSNKSQYDLKCFCIQQSVNCFSVTFTHYGLIVRTRTYEDKIEQLILLKFHFKAVTLSLRLLYVCFKLLTIDVSLPAFA